MSLPTRRGADTMPRAISSKVVELPAQLRRSLTWCGDREIADDAGFKAAIAVAVHVCDPRAAWPHGTHDTTETLIRHSPSR
jgi:IS30 family transposase